MTEGVAEYYSVVEEAERYLEGKESLEKENAKTVVEAMAKWISKEYVNKSVELCKVPEKLQVGEIGVKWRMEQASLNADLSRAIWVVGEVARISGDDSETAKFCENKIRHTLFDGEEGVVAKIARKATDNSLEGYRSKSKLKEDAEGHIIGAIGVLTFANLMRELNPEQEGEGMDLVRFMTSADVDVKDKIDLKIENDGYVTLVQLKTSRAFDRPDVFPLEVRAGGVRMSAEKVSNSHIKKMEAYGKMLIEEGKAREVVLFEAHMPAYKYKKDNRDQERSVLGKLTANEKSLIAENREYFINNGFLSNREEAVAGV
jgi:hypothetical protein